jgi:aminoacrylate hydrolase
MQFELRGCQDDGAPAILLSAGLGGAGAFWQPQLDALGERYRLVLYDQRGTGRNRAPLPEPYSIGMMADDVLEVLDAAGIQRCHFMGHALGGLVGLDLALRAPERLASLILVNAWARADPHTLRCFEARLALLRHVGAEAYVKAQPIFLYPGTWLTANAERVAAEEAHGIAHFQGSETIQRRIAALMAFDVTARLAEITTPTLVAASRDDVLVPWHRSRDLAAGLPNAQLWLVPEGGHGFTVTEPAPFNVEALRFLDALG